MGLTLWSPCRMEARVITTTRALGANVILSLRLEKGVRNVPTVFINDRVYHGRLSQPELTKAIEEECHTGKRKRA